MATQEYQSLMYKGLTIVNKSFDAQASAISNLDRQYRQDSFSQINLSKSLDILLSTNVKGGKVVLCGVGKSFKIASKLSATLNSLSIQSSTLHPTEALHGDLGMLNDRDCIIMLTASGNTPELVTLLPHINNIPIILLTCHKDSKLAQHPKVKSLLYTELPSHLKEETIHGIPAPTVSATLSLVMADSVILALAELIESSVAARKKLFSIKHPGGSIGANLSHLNDNINFSGNAQHSSFSSFLSLGDVKKTLSNDQSSSVSSDDETFDALTMRFKSASAAKIYELKDTQELKRLDEPGFLRCITLYDFILIDSIVGETSTLKALYVQNISQGSEWNDNLIDGFKQVGAKFEF